MTINPKAYTQLSPEWFALRKTKVTASDVPAIMGMSKYKTALQLYDEKINDKQVFVNDAMRRGVELEPIARQLFCARVGIKMEPDVIVSGDFMASLDGISECKRFIVEIKCAGAEDHAIALNGNIPKHYYPQIQMQIYLADVEFAYYFSFDGFDGVIVIVKKDVEFITKMIAECRKFFDCMQNKIPPAPQESDYIETSSETWEYYADRYKQLQQEKKTLEDELEKIQNEFITMSEGHRTKGFGISVCPVERKGNIDYAKVPELKNIDLEQYRKKSSSYWKISQY